MSQLVKNKMGITAIWTDGYLPPREVLIKNIRNYHSERPEFNPLQLNYEPCKDWPIEEIFKSAAFFITTDFYHKFKGYRQQPCDIWLTNPNDENNLYTKYIVAETKADSRKEDYHHIISVHNAESALKCISRLLDSVGFESKPNDNYIEQKAFQENCEYIIYRILETYTEPYSATDKTIRAYGFARSGYNGR